MIEVICLWLIILQKFDKKVLKIKINNKNKGYKIINKMIYYLKQFFLFKII